MEDAAGPQAPRAGVNPWMLTAVLFLGAMVAVGVTWVASRDAQTPIQRVAPPPTPSRTPLSHTAFCRQSYSLRPLPINPDRGPEITDITAIDRATVRVRWTVGYDDHPVAYVVALVCENGHAFRAYAVEPHTMEYVFRGLQPATSYCFRVQKVNMTDLFSPQRCISTPR